ncbi:MAG: hypothetical protein Rubg2KO_30300 [Rubricoccaceae bacterium]
MEPEQSTYVALTMSKPFAQSREELEEHLRDQLRFLRRSADAFDEGDHGEAKRMALQVRVLVHDTGQSTSLLTHLGLQKLTFLDTSSEYVPGNLVGQSMLTSGIVGTRGAVEAAPLDRAVESRGRMVPFPEWWDRVVFANLGETSLCRRDVVLDIAHKDGGAHVDANLKEPMARLSRYNSLQRFIVDPDGNKSPLLRIELVAMRQIAHEVIRTFDPGYRRDGPSPKCPTDGTPSTEEKRWSLVMGGPYIEPGGIVIPHRYAHKVGRNDPCPCESGRKYKHCCGRPPG